jgi:hypothetical protein
MRIFSNAGGEPVSQVQYDVRFHFQMFDPPPGAAEPNRGHNLMPFAGDNQWYAVQSAVGMDGSSPAAANQAATPYHYADFSDLFQIL